MGSVELVVVLIASTAVFGHPSAVPAKHIFTFILSDDQMRTHLRSGSTLIFKGLERDWQTVERQVERLGFGELYLVSRNSGRRGDLTKVSPLAER
jgi:hypothetical protein